MSTQNMAKNNNNKRIKNKYKMGKMGGGGGGSSLFALSDL